MKILLFLTISLILYSNFAFAQSAKLDAYELEVLKVIWMELGLAENNLDSYMYLCSGKANFEASGDCDCFSESNTTCRVTKIIISSQNISTYLPSEFSKLQYLQSLDLSRNYLEETIPDIWSSMHLSTLSLMGNRLYGSFPKALTKMITLTDLSLEGNLFSGTLPKEIAYLHNLEKLDLSSNDFSGELPVTLANLTKLTDVRISDNNFKGKIPNLISQWTQIGKLHIQGCSFEGPIPSSISTLTQLTDLRISDLIGGPSTFPPLEKMVRLKILVLRNCFIHGPIPNYVGNLRSLQTLDLSFNNLTGNIPSSFLRLNNAHYIYLTENNLSGPIPPWVMMDTIPMDLSYNNFTYDAFGPKTCGRGLTNVVEGYSLSTNQQNNIHPCLMKGFPCNKPNEHKIHSLHINCGGGEVIINNTIKYSADLERIGPSSYYNGGNWAFSSTGNFLDNYVNPYTYIFSTTSDIYNIPTSDTELYRKARTAAISLTYYGLCLVNGNYTVRLHFAEIVFFQDELFNGLGKRVFDVYVQGELKIKDFDIAKEARGSGIAVIKCYTVNVKNNTLKIQLYWGGKGTTGIPVKGSYGPIISAISVEPNFVVPRHGKKLSDGLVAGIVVGACLVLLIMLILWRRGYKMTQNQLIETGHLSTSTSFS